MAPSESHRSRVERERESSKRPTTPGFSPFSFFFHFFSFLPPLPHLHFCFRPLPLFLFFARARGRVARICFSALLIFTFCFSSAFSFVFTGIGALFAVPHSSDPSAFQRPPVKV